jgi:hypothetical protein
MPKRKLKEVKETLPPERDEFILYLEGHAQDHFDRDSSEQFKYSANLGLYPHNAWDFLSSPLGINEEERLKLLQKVKYNCLFSGNVYYGAYPVGYLSTKKPTLKGNPDDTVWVDMILKELVHPQDIQRETSHIGQVGRSLMGHGISDKTLGEGSDPRLTDVIVEITQTEFLIFKVWKQRRD